MSEYSLHEIVDVYVETNDGSCGGNIKGKIIGERSTNGYMEYQVEFQLYDYLTNFAVWVSPSEIDKDILEG